MNSNSNQLKLGIRDLLKVALPLCAGAFIQFMVVIIDNFFVAQLNNKAMSAVGYVGLIYIALSMFSAGLANAAQILIARKVGEQAEHEVHGIFGQSILLALPIAAFQSLALYFLIPFILEWSIGDQDTLNYMLEFAHTRSYGFIFFAAIQIFQALWSGMANTRSIFYSTITIAVLTITFDYLFIFGNCGMPAWGVSGAGIATDMGEAGAAIVLLIYTFRRKESKHLHLFRNWLKRTKRHFKTLLKLGVPIMLQLLVALSIWIIFFGFIEDRGEDSFHSAFIVRNMYSLAWISVMGFSTTTKTYVSGLMGERRDHEIYPTLRKLALLNTALLFLLTHGLWLYPEFIAHLFNATPLTVALTVKSMHVVLIPILVFGITSVMLAAVEGSGKTIQGFLIELATTLIYISYSYYLVYKTDVDVAIIWTADIVYFVCIGLFSLISLRGNRWYKKYTQKI
jgi:putative MATE family efflux protein